MEIARVILFTPDVKRLSDFYRSSFGLREIEGGSDDWVELTSGTCNIAFHRFDDTSATRDGWIKVVFGAKDVAAEKQRLESLGVEMSEVVEFGDIRLCDGRDPDGNWFQVSSRGL